jgi:hypothetical protein
MLAVFAMIVIVYLSCRSAGLSDVAAGELPKVTGSVELSAGCYININNTP